jgi:cobyrinic acid a,c-diamide synthase
MMAGDSSHTSRRCPRILVAGTHSGVGKTTVTLGILAALRRRGVAAAPFKAGPDYIDPTLHAQAAGRPSRNLDQWLLDRPALMGVLRRGMRTADLAVIEGVMGLYDGIGSGQDGSTAAVARSLACPVILVLDVAAMSSTAAALVLGCRDMQPGVNLVGVVLNRVGNDAHARNTSEAIGSATGLPVVGSLPADPNQMIPERHLGLVPASEGSLPAATLMRLADLVERRFDLDAVIRIARTAPLLSELDVPPQPPARPRACIGVAQDEAFGFYYEDALDVLAECGADLIPFSPLHDARLPEHVDGVYLGGGFPELHAEELAANAGMRAALVAHAESGRPVYAECGGLMAVGRTLTTFEGRTLSMFGLLPVDSRMQRDHPIIGYREVEAVQNLAVLPRGARVRGHEFHWSEADAPTPPLAAYRVVGEDRFEGYKVGATLGSYVHLNLSGLPHLARRFVDVCARRPVPGRPNLDRTGP